MTQGRHSFMAEKCCHKILGPMTYKGTYDTTLFEKGIEKILPPELSPGEIIIIDSTTFHKSKRTKNFMENPHCHVLFLPPYSPYFNSIERFLAWFKGQIRELINTVSSLEQAIDHVFNSCTY